MRTTFNEDGTQTHDTEGATTVNPTLYAKLLKLAKERHQILTGQSDLSEETDKNSFTWLELRINLPQVEADILEVVKDLLKWSELERRLGAHDPRFQPQPSVEALHQQAEKLKELPPYLAATPDK